MEGRPVNPRIVISLVVVAVLAVGGGLFVYLDRDTAEVASIDNALGALEESDGADPTGEDPEDESSADDAASTEDAASADPALNPNQPNQSRPEPSSTNGT